MNKKDRNAFLEKEKEIQQKINFGNLMKPTFSENGELLGFQIRTDLVLTMFHSNNFSTIILKRAIKQAAITESVILRKVNEHGQHYNMKFMLITDAGESLILVAWTIRFDEDFPRLTNCYPVNK